jgi:RNA polymerase sigma factor (TIGR02999 family)
VNALALARGAGDRTRVADASTPVRRAERGYTPRMPVGDQHGASEGPQAAVGEATQLLQRLGNGAAADAERLLELIYSELRRLAASFLEQEREGHTLQPTALVHEAYLKLIDQSRVQWKNRAHFFGIAAQAMRRILVDHARARQREKRGGRWIRVELEPSAAATSAAPRDDADELVALDAALERLKQVSERQARIVELKFFGGLSSDAAAEALELSPSTVDREWRFARAWLAREIRPVDG